MEFHLKVENTERQLSTVFCHAFDDAAGLEHAFKVSKTFWKCDNKIMSESLFWCGAAHMLLVLVITTSLDIIHRQFQCLSLMSL